jgi:hypothetical protein
MIDKFKENIQLSQPEKRLKLFNTLLVLLGIFFIFYTSVVFYKIKRDVNSSKTPQTQTDLTSLQHVEPHIKVYGELEHDTIWISQKEFKRGDVVLIKHIKREGIVMDKELFSKDYFTVLYETKFGEINTIHVPSDLLLKKHQVE